MNERGVSSASPAPGSARGSDVQLITLYDDFAGFCALITYALNGIRHAEEHGRIAVVRYDGSPAPCSFLEPERGDNVWEYYFEPVMEVSSDEVRSRLSETVIWRQSEEDVLRDHQRDPDRIATFWAWEEPSDPKAWMERKRRLGRQYVSKYVRVKQHILEKAEAFRKEHFSFDYMIGAHVRGTDFAYAEPTALDEYFKAIDERVDTHGKANFGIFLATDQQQFVGSFQDRYGDRVVTYDCLRSTTDVAPFKLSTNSPYALGEEMLLDILLMASCNHLIKGAAAGGEYALWFAPQLTVTDFATRSHFEAKPYEWLQPAFRKLDVDGKGRFHGRASRILRLTRDRLVYALSKFRHPPADRNAE